MSVKQKIKNAIKLLRTKEKIPIPQPINAQKLLNGKIALITGGSGGVGYAMAKAFINSGCKVIIAGTNEDKLQNCCEKHKRECPENSDAFDYITLNVLDVKSMPEKVRCAATKFSENRIDILVNSAGLVAHSDFVHMAEEEYDKIMDVNAKGHIL